MLHKCRHIVPFRCMMHGFGLVMISVIAYPWARRQITRAQSVVAYFRMSHRPLRALDNARKTLQISRRLQSANKTRMTSTGSMVASVMENEAALKLVVSRHDVVIKAEIKAIIDDRIFWQVRHLRPVVLRPLDTQLGVRLQACCSAHQTVSAGWRLRLCAHP
jgi:hypothetical protein